VIEPQGARLVNSDHYMPYGTTFFVLRLRLRMRSDPKQRPSDHQWHEKQIPQPSPRDPAIIPLLAHHCPPPVQLTPSSSLLRRRLLVLRRLKARPERTARLFGFARRLAVC